MINNKGIVRVSMIQEAAKVELKRKPDLTYDLESVLAKLDIEVKVSK